MIQAAPHTTGGVTSRTRNAPTPLVWVAEDVIHASRKHLKCERPDNALKRASHHASLVVGPV